MTEMAELLNQNSNHSSNFDSERIASDSIFIIKDAIINEPSENKNSNTPGNSATERKTVEIQLILRNQRPNSLKKLKFDKKTEDFPKIHLKKTKTSGKIRRPKKDSTRILKPNAETKVSTVSKDSPNKEIHLKEEENIDRKLFYHSYRGFSNIVEYLGKFEWYNNASFQNKQLPIKFLTPICFWFIVCYNYFPRHIFSKNVSYFVDSTIAKCAKVVPDIKLRLNKNLIKFANKSMVPEENEDSFPEILNQVLAKNMRPFFNDNVQKMYEKKVIQKNNYTADDDLFIVQVRHFLSGQNLKFLELIKNPKSAQFGANTFDQEILKEEEGNVDDEKLRNDEETKEIDDFNESNLKKESNEKMEIESKVKILQEIPTTTLISAEDSDLLGKVNQNLKKISLNNLINLYSLDLSNQKSENERMVQKLKQALEAEKDIQKFFDVDENISDDMLYDISFFTKDELEYLNLLENKQQKVNHAKSTPIKDFERNENKIKVYNHTDDTVCQICNDGDYIDENLIVFCSKCNISVHQYCYGILVIPHGDWICDLCKEIGPSGKFLRCPLCQEIGGAMKKSVLNCETQLFTNLNPFYHDYLKKCQKSHSPQLKPEMGNLLEENQEVTAFDVWVHLTCVLWLPETYFQDKQTYSNVRGLENIDPKKFEAFCVICHSSNSGACVQCAKNKCQISFHPECARRAKLNMEVKLTDKLNYYIYCEKHTPLKLKRLLENKEKKYQEEIIKFSRTIEKYYETYNSEHRLKTNQLLKTKRFLKKFCSKVRLEQTKDTTHFLNSLKDHFNSFEENKFIIYLSKTENPMGPSVSFEFLDLNIPTQFTCIPKHDILWTTFFYKNLTPEQIYKKYYSISKRYHSWKQQNLPSEAIINPEPIPMKLPMREEPEKEKQSFNKISIRIPDLLEDPEKLYCVCKRPYGEGEQMMECEKCLEWFHFDCIGFSGSLEEAEDFHFVCPDCATPKKSEKKHSKSKSPEKSRKKLSIEVEMPNSKKASVDKMGSALSKKKEVNITESVPVCKRTRKHSNSQAKISSSTSRQEKQKSRKTKKSEEKKKEIKTKETPTPETGDPPEEKESRKSKRKISESLTKKLKKN